MTNIGGVWYKKESAKGLPPIKRSKISQKSQYKDDEIRKNK